MRRGTASRSVSLGFLSNLDEMYRTKIFKDFFSVFPLWMFL